MSPSHSNYTHDHVFLGSAHDENARRTLWVVALTVVMMVGEVTAGYITGSMALLAGRAASPCSHRKRRGRSHGKRREHS
jgi:Co/Zn/Cd efflux system component